MVTGTGPHCYPDLPDLKALSRLFSNESTGFAAASQFTIDIQLHLFVSRSTPTTCVPTADDSSCTATVDSSLAERNEMLADRLPASGQKPSAGPPIAMITPLGLVEVIQASSIKGRPVHQDWATWGMRAGCSGLRHHRRLCQKSSGISGGLGSAANN